MNFGKILQNEKFKVFHRIWISFVDVRTKLKTSGNFQNRTDSTKDLTGLTAYLRPVVGPIKFLDPPYLVGVPGMHLEVDIVAHSVHIIQRGRGPTHVHGFNLSENYHDCNYFTFSALISA